jgi:hypothetical protein
MPVFSRAGNQGEKSEKGAGMMMMMMKCLIIE